MFGSLVPFIIKSGFGAGGRRPDRQRHDFRTCSRYRRPGRILGSVGRRFVYQFNLLLFGVFTILGAFAPNITLLVICRFIAGLGLGAEQPLAFAYAGECTPKRIRGRILAFVHFIGGACVWPIGTALVLGFGLLRLMTMLHNRSHVWRGVWLSSACSR